MLVAAHTMWSRSMASFTWIFLAEFRENFCWDFLNPSIWTKQASALVNKFGAEAVHYTSIPNMLRVSFVVDVHAPWRSAVRFVSWAWRIVLADIVGSRFALLFLFCHRSFLSGSEKVLPSLGNSYISS